MATQAEPVEPPLPEALTRAPFDELSFVPAESEAVVRVDLGKLASSQGDAGQALDFMLRAQQTAAWDVLSGAGIHAGRELRAIYLVVGPRASSGDAFLLAGVGTFDRARLIDGLTRTGATVQPAPGGGAMFVWRGGTTDKAGAALPPARDEIGPVALGVGEGLLLLGPPELVQRSLTARAGGGKDARRTLLADELLQVDPGASAWGVAVAPGARAYLNDLMPGLQHGRFSTTVAGPGAEGAVSLRAQFATAEQAKAFRDQVSRTLAQLGAIADASPVGATLTRLREAGVHVDGTTVTAGDR